MKGNDAYARYDYNTHNDQIVLAFEFFRGRQPPAKRSSFRVFFKKIQQLHTAPRKLLPLGLCCVYFPFCSHVIKGV